MQLLLSPVCVPRGVGGLIARGAGTQETVVNSLCPSSLSASVSGGAYPPRLVGSLKLLGGASAVDSSFGGGEGGGSGEEGGIGGLASDLLLLCCRTSLPKLEAPIDMCKSSAALKRCRLLVAWDAR